MVPSSSLLGLPGSAERVVLRLGDREVPVTNLGKLFWPDLGITKGDLLEYYAGISSALLPHLRDRAAVMKRYPDGAFGKFFFMKRAPAPRPDWIEICSIDHGSQGVIDFPMVQDLASLLWIVNLGCIDMNPWYARCDDVDRPDFLHFDLDPVKGDPPVPFSRLLEAAVAVRDGLASLDMPSFAKTTGSRGMHVYVPLEQGPDQKRVWEVARDFAVAIAQRHPRLLTAEYAVARRPAGRVVVDYNQNAWGQTLASVYSVRPHPRAAVSTPVTWAEVEAGFALEDFHIGNVRERVAEVGDLWAPLLTNKQRVRL
jgi:bifunctional non-homologous end joining protein LigD